MFQLFQNAKPFEVYFKSDIKVSPASAMVLMSSETMRARVKVRMNQNLASVASHNSGLAVVKAVVPAICKREKLPNATAIF